MIDVHCHLEQKDYDKDRDAVIEECRKKMKAVITSCAHANTLDLTLKIAQKYKGFVYASIGLHPEYIKEIKEKDVENVIETIVNNQKQIVAIGEVGLDYHWVQEMEWREKQKQMFRQFIKLAKKLHLPLIVHSRSAMQDTLDILAEEKYSNVLLHLFTDKHNLQRVIDENYRISIGPGIKQSKDIRKIARDMPIDRILLETDSPWWGDGERGTPLNVFKAAEKIAEIRKITIEEVEKQTDLNAMKFFNLKK